MYVIQEKLYEPVAIIVIISQTISGTMFVRQLQCCSADQHTFVGMDLIHSDITSKLNTFTCLGHRHYEEKDRNMCGN